MPKSAKTSGPPTGLRDVSPSFRTDFRDRLAWLIGLFETKAGAARAAGVTPEQLARYLSGATPKMPVHILFNLANEKGVSLDFLGSGKGERFSNAPNRVAYVVLPILEAALGASGGGEQVAFPRLLLSGAKFADESLCLAVHHGRANEPDLRDGEFIVLDRSVTTFVVDGFYAIDRDGQMVFRFIERDITGGVVVKARNPTFDSRMLTIDQARQLKVLGRAIWAGGLL